MTSTRRLFFLLAAGTLWLAGCSSESPAPPAVVVEITPVSNGVALKANDDVETPAHERLEVRRLQFYLSQPRLKTAQGQWLDVRSDPSSDLGYALFDLARPETGRFRLPPFPAGDYTEVAFTVGVDAARNRGGAQSGVLDPARGMFWTWATGYIHFKLEGRSPAAPGTEQAVILHLGGADVARSIRLPLGSKPLRIRPGLQPTLHLQADLAGFLGGPEPLSFARSASVMGGPEAVALADRLGNLLRVDHLHHEPAGAQPR